MPVMMFINTATQRTAVNLNLTVIFQPHKANKKKKKTKHVFKLLSSHDMTIT